VQSVDTDKEIIYKTATHSIMTSDLDDVISSDRAGYHIFRYAHRHNNEDNVTNGKYICYRRSPHVMAIAIYCRNKSFVCPEYMLRAPR